MTNILYFKFYFLPHASSFFYFYILTKHHFMSFNKKQNTIFYIALTLAVLQLIQYLISGSIFSTLLAGLVPFWLWSTRKKVLADLKISGFDQVMSYLVVIYAAFAGLVALLVFVFWLIYASVDPAIIEAAMADNPAINEFNEDELLALDRVMEKLPSLLPLMWVFLGLQSFSYLYYGIGVVRKAASDD